MVARPFVGIASGETDAMARPSEHKAPGCTGLQTRSLQLHLSPASRLGTLRPVLALGVSLLEMPSFALAPKAL